MGFGGGKCVKEIAKNLVFRYTIFNIQFSGCWKITARKFTERNVWNRNYSL